MQDILLASKKKQIVRTLVQVLGDEPRIKKVTSSQASLNSLGSRRFDLCLLDLELIGSRLPLNEARVFKAGFERYLKAAAETPIVIMTEPDHLRQAVWAVKAGAEDYLCHPIEIQEIDMVLHNLSESLNVKSELNYLRHRFWKGEAEDLVTTRSLRMQALYDSIQAVASTKATVLIHGDTGTGKSLLARLIHLHSNRSNGAFVSVHCGSIPETLVESELFGHEKGSFTGAERRKLGRFQVADGGTIFLDEVGTITPNAQIKLLQVLQEGTFSRVGGEKDITVDVRVIAASNEDLKTKTQQGLFRRDLYYRLNVFPVELPKLKDRSEDISHFVKHFIGKLNLRYGKEIKGVTPEVLSALKAYDWPGNIRELENLMERAYILETGSRLGNRVFPVEVMGLAPAPAAMGQDMGEFSLSQVREKAMAEVEYRYLTGLLEQHAGRVGPCAAQAGVSTRQFHNLLVKHRLKSRDYRSRVVS